MADNIQAKDASGATVTMATDDVGGGVQCSRAKIVWGPDGTANDADVASGKPLPVQRRDPSGNATPAMDVVGRAGFQKVTDGTNTLTVDSAGLASVHAYPQTDAIYAGVTALTPKFAKISCAASGENALVALVSSKRIRVLSLFIAAAGAVNGYFKDAAGGSAIFGDATNPIDLAAAGSGFALQYNPLGWMQSAVGSALVLNLSGAVGVGGCVVYVEV